jgi:type II secretory pathway pseudopilin PulG
MGGHVFFKVRKIMIKRMKNNLGYTLAEITITTAIIGSLAAIAVPNFLRIKMNVNMELVKQQMRILGQNLNELYNQNNPHQYPEDILTLDGNPAEELSITASLNAIDGMGYTDHRWQTAGSPPSTFALRRCPGDGLWGIVGVECYTLTPGGLTAGMPWDGGGLDMIIMSVNSMDGPVGTSRIFNYFLAEPTLTEDQRVQLIADFLETSAYILLMRQLYYVESGMGGGLVGKMPATLFQFLDALSVASNTNRSTFEALLPQVYAELENRGVTMLTKSATVTSDGSWSGDPVYQWTADGGGSMSMSNCGTSCISQGSYSQVGFQYEDSVNTRAAAITHYQAAAARYVQDREAYLGV